MTGREPIKSPSGQRIFKRRRRPHSALVSLLHDVKDNCQSWLGVFRSSPEPDRRDLSPEHSPVRSPHRPQWFLEQSPVRRPQWDLEQTQDLELDWSRTEETVWSKLNSTELEDNTPFVYDPTEAPPPPDKLPQILDQPCPDTCQSQDTFGQSVGGLSEVPPTLFKQPCRCQSSEQKTGLSLSRFLLFIFTLFIMAAVYSRCLWWSSAVVSALFLSVSTFMMVTKSGPMGQWRKAKTEDITSRNE
ncbi:hypothetical protein WMY93_000207 [Mugilogobius chulae]|uniref:Transmembrane protein 71 n=1 Tax=Mugilogobius chulae TaxID=88201 RepID=A0AAW0QDN4_9GOBI